MNNTKKLQVDIPENVEACLTLSKFGYRCLIISGPKGRLTRSFNSSITILISEGCIHLECANNIKYLKSLLGLYRTLLLNMIEGVVQGYEQRLNLVGIGYKATKESNILRLKLGYSHDLLYHIPAGVDICISSSTLLIISGIDKELVSKVATDIRSFKKPDAYKGKGVRFYREELTLKEGKRN
uniref:Ribosomal protein L6 n=1 Tax=Imasa heleensis TaxID=2772037 RepID=A0A893DDI1_9EUKA|nr:ribosomal protein L6 [Imasa heleensis]QRR29763.1 ribosomal protein L6 [Imasa heleensis]